MLETGWKTAEAKTTPRGSWVIGQPERVGAGEVAPAKRVVQEQDLQDAEREGAEAGRKVRVGEGEEEPKETSRQRVIRWREWGSVGWEERG